MATYKTDPRVDEYISKLHVWQAEICQMVRDVVHAANPGVEETIKRSVQPYFVLNGNVCALLAAKEHVNIFIYDPDAPDPEGIINQGHDNATAKAIQVAERQIVNRPALLTMFEAIVTRNRAGGWHKLRAQ